MSATHGQRHFDEPLQQADPRVSRSIQGELSRQQDQIELIASENLVSRAVLQAQGSVMTNKTVEGYPGKRYYGGAQFADEIESLGIERACSLFDCRFANLQPHSGSNANQAAYLSCLSPGDTILSMDTVAGGHISHGHPATLTARMYNIVTYGLHQDTEQIDYEQAHQQAREHRPAMIIAGGSAYSRIIDFERLATIAQEVDAVFMVDMAHFAGLVASGLYPNPLRHADIVTATTYKSLRGARGGLILWNDPNRSKAINQAVFPGVQGSVLLHAVAGKTVCLGEAASSAFTAYSQQVIDNGHALAQALSDEGLRVVSGGSDTGLMLVDVSAAGTDGDTAVNCLEAAGLTCNKNMIPFDTLPAEICSGIRLSTNAGTSRGFEAEQFAKVGRWIAKLVQANGTNQADVIRQLRVEVNDLCDQYPIY